MYNPWKAFFNIGGVWVFLIIAISLLRGREHDRFSVWMLSILLVLHVTSQMLDKRVMFYKDEVIEALRESNGLLDLQVKLSKVDTQEGREHVLNVWLMTPQGKKHSKLDFIKNDRNDLL